MKKTKEAKEEKTKNEPKMKIYEHIKSIANTNWWVSQLKRVFFFFFFRIKIERVREWVFFFFFLFSFFSYLSLLSTFCNLFFCKLKIWWWPDGISLLVTLSLQLFSLWEMGLHGLMGFGDTVCNIYIYIYIFFFSARNGPSWFDGIW